MSNEETNKSEPASLAEAALLVRPSIIGTPPWNIQHALHAAGWCLVRQSEMDAHYDAIKVQRAMAATVDAALTSEVYGLSDDDVAELACKVAEVAREQADWLSSARDGVGQMKALEAFPLAGDELAALVAALTPVQS